MTTTLDPQTVTAAVFARLKSDGAGASVRAALGSGAASVISAAKLRQQPLPARPLAALRSGVIAGESHDMRDFVYGWWLYDELSENGWRIGGLVKLIEAAYPRFSIPYGLIRVTGIGQETTDEALGLITRRVELTYTRRA